MARLWFIISWVLLFSACSSVNSVPPTEPPALPLAKTLRFYGWPDDVDPSVLQAFTEKNGIEIQYISYADQETAMQSLRAGDVYDLVVLSNEYVAVAVQEQLLAELPLNQINNFRHISPNFRNLAYDPNNQHAIPYNWGVTGIAVRSNLLKRPLTRWSDLWQQPPETKIVMWNYPRYVMAGFLKGLGYSINTEVAAELAAAREKLLQVRPQTLFTSEADLTFAPYLGSGAAVIGLGGGVRDLVESAAVAADTQFVTPQEGLILWGDNFVVPRNSPNAETAYTLLNFLLEPENGAAMMQFNSYATPNETALERLPEDLRLNPFIFPPNAALKNAEIMLPVSTATENWYETTWSEFIVAGGT